MALLKTLKKGSVDRSVTLRIIDATTGLPVTTAVFNSAGIDLWYRREGAAVVSITEATLAALTTAHTDGGFLHISHGEYRLDVPDAAFATGANHVTIGGTITGMIVIGGDVQLVDFDLESARVLVQDRYIQGQAVDNFPFVMIATANNLPATGKTVAVAYSHDDGTSFTSLGNATEKANGSYQIDLTTVAMGAQQVLLRFTNADCYDKLIAISTVP